MQGLWDILDSERGIAFLVIMICAFVLILLGRITVEQWMTFVQVIGIAFIGSKTVTSAIEAVKLPKATVVSSAPSPPATPPAAPAP